MVYAICKEAMLQRNYINETIDTIYFGGGTPSLLSGENLKAILDKVQELFSINANSEITLEANPDDINEEKLAAWKTIGINRLSIGVQSFFEGDLQWMNRAHNATQALQSIQLAQQYGFNNITIDLIYGTPTLTNEKWKQNVEKAFELGVPHLSCYALTVEPKTALEKMIAAHKIAAVDAERQSKQFELLMEWTNALGYEHYEISNFAKPGFRSKHNSSYWKGQKYLGVGPSAHSFDGKIRYWNVSNNTIYINKIEANEPAYEQEVLSERERYNEYVMTSLRTVFGVAVKKINHDFGDIYVRHFHLEIAPFIEKKWVECTDEIYTLTDLGKLFCDFITEELFIIKN